MASPGTGLLQKRRKRIPIEHYEQVRTMLISMMPMSEIEKQCGAKFGKSRGYIRTVIQQIHQDWEEGAITVQTTRRHQIRQGFELLFAQARIDKDWQTCTRILTELGKLDGCYAPSAVTMTHQGQVGVGISLGSLGFKSPEEVRDRVEWLKAQIAAKGPSAVQAGQPLLVAQAHLAGEAVDNLQPGVSLPDTQVIDVPSDPVPSDQDPEGTP